MLGLKLMPTMILNWRYLLSDQITMICSDYYDLLILDIKMPKVDGYELYDKIRKIDDKVKVCFLTASERYKEEHRPSFLSSGSTSFLIKPITVDDLVKKVNEMIKQK